MTAQKGAVAIVSGGMDSVTLAYLMHKRFKDRLTLVSFNYGQRHSRELVYARKCAAVLGVKHMALNMRFLGKLLSNSALTGSTPVPDGHYAEKSMKATVVPNRNMIMLSIAGGVAINIGASHLGIAVHSGDHFIYPDCRPPFINAMQQALTLGNEGFTDYLELYAPFIGKDKAGIVAVGRGLGVPYEDTYSCYKGGEIHCGTCGTCVERQEAFKLSGVNDPTHYETRWEG